MAIHPRARRLRRVHPDAWEHDLALLDRPGVDAAQLRLFGDYSTNRGLYPHVHHWLRDSQVPVLAVWGRHDEIFAYAGAEAFRRDSPHVHVVPVDGGHFLLESHLDEVVAAIRDWADHRPVRERSSDSS